MSPQTSGKTVFTARDEIPLRPLASDAKESDRLSEWGVVP